MTTVTIELPAWSRDTWISIGLGVYLALSYLVVGPLLTRWYSASSDRPGAWRDPFTFFIWLYSPLWPIVGVFAGLGWLSYRPLTWLIYGPQRRN